IIRVADKEQLDDDPAAAADERQPGVLATALAFRTAVGDAPGLADGGADRQTQLHVVRLAQCFHAGGSRAAERIAVELQRNVMLCRHAPRSGQWQVLTGIAILAELDAPG